MKGFIAVAQPTAPESWDDSPSIPKDDAAFVMTLAPLFGLLVAYGTILFAAATGRTP